LDSSRRGTFLTHQTVFFSFSHFSLRLQSRAADCNGTYLCNNNNNADINNQRPFKTEDKPQLVNNNNNNSNSNSPTGRFNFDPDKLRLKEENFFGCDEDEFQGDPKAADVPFLSQNLKRSPFYSMS